MKKQDRKKQKTVSVNAMAPLLVGNPKGDPQSEERKTALDQFNETLKKAKEAGIRAISVDFWWGLIEPVEGTFDFKYYDPIVDHILDAGLDLIIIVSLHKCGGNVGDGDNEISIPAWMFKKLAKKFLRQVPIDSSWIFNSQVPIDDSSSSRLVVVDAGQQLPLGFKFEEIDENAVKYVGEDGYVSNDCVPAYLEDLALPNYRAVFEAIRDHYADKASRIAEVNISLGPAGELRYPAYRVYDIVRPDPEQPDFTVSVKSWTDYPNRGALQFYSELAIQRFREWLIGKYENVQGIARAWGMPFINRLEQIRPPEDPNAFFRQKDHLNLQYGHDLFDWSNETLLGCGRKRMLAAISVFGALDSAFFSVDIAAKGPGIHWRIGTKDEHGNVILGDRLAELTAGLIRTSDRSEQEMPDGGRGYRPFIRLFRELNDASSYNRIVLHFTCLEMRDGVGGAEVASLALTLVGWIGREAAIQLVPLGGENSLAGNLLTRASWDRMRQSMVFNGGSFEMLNILRASDAVSTEVTLSETVKTTRLAREWQDEHGVKPSDEQSEGK